MAAILAAPGRINVYNVIIFMFFIFLLTMFIALYERMHKKAPYLSLVMLIAMSAAAAIGATEAIINIVSVRMLAPLQDLSAYRAFWTVSSALDKTALYITEWAVLFAGCAILRIRSFSRILGWMFVVRGILAIPGIVPYDITGISVLFSYQG